LNESKDLNLDYARGCGYLILTYAKASKILVSRFREIGYGGVGGPMHFRGAACSAMALWR